MLSFEETIYHVRKAKLGDENSKEVLLKNNTLLIKSIANRFRNKGVDYDDLYQLGCVGFLKAISNYNEEFNTRFSTYAVPMIMGEIKRFLRDDGEIKVSRIIKMQYVEISKFTEKYIKDVGKEPTIEEIASALNLSKEDIVLALESNKMPISLYENVDDGDEKSQTLIDKIPSNYSEDEHVNNLYLQSLLNALNDRERKILILRYFRDKTQGEVAKILGVSQVQISRLEMKILKKIKEKEERKLKA